MIINFSTICTSRIFSGITEEELNEMLDCLDAKTVHFPKGEYILRSGDTVESLGVMISGNAFIIHEDFWGNRNTVKSFSRRTAPQQRRI